MNATKKQFKWPIVGHKNIIDFLQKSIVNDKIAHAYLFYGPEHIGKTIVAENFIASLLCQNQRDTIPCGKCIYCQQFFKGIHPDVYFIEKEKDKKNISIEQIRDLRHKLNLRSFLNSYKIALIKGAENLNKQAFNSFLKTLEEPSQRAIIILITQNISFFPKTILSRCQLVKFLPVATSEISKYLIKHFKLDEKKAQNLAHFSLGRPGIAINFFQEPNLLKDYQTEIQEFIEIIKGNLQRKFQIIGHLFSETKFLESIDIFQKKLLIWSLIIRDLILIKTDSDNFMVNNFIKDNLIKLADKYSQQELITILSEINKTKKYLSQNINPRLAVENLMFLF